MHKYCKLLQATVNTILAFQIPCIKEMPCETSRTKTCNFKHILSLSFNLICSLSWTASYASQYVYLQIKGKVLSTDNKFATSFKGHISYGAPVPSEVLLQRAVGQTVMSNSKSNP